MNVYDIALIIGCVGSEAPDARHASFLRAFKKTITNNYSFDKKIFRYLPWLVIAQRFAWMSEWLRRHDVEMIEFELYYIHQLMNDISEGY